MVSCEHGGYCLCGVFPSIQDVEDAIQAIPADSPFERLSAKGAAGNMTAGWCSVPIRWCLTHRSRLNSDEYPLSGRCRAYLWDRGPLDGFVTDEPCRLVDATITYQDTDAVDSYSGGGGGG